MLRQPEVPSYPTCLKVLCRRSVFMLPSPGARDTAIAKPELVDIQSWHSSRCNAAAQWMRVSLKADRGGQSIFAALTAAALLSPAAATAGGDPKAVVMLVDATAGVGLSLAVGTACTWPCTAVTCCCCFCCWGCLFSGRPAVTACSHSDFVAAVLPQPAAAVPAASLLVS